MPPKICLNRALSLLAEKFLLLQATAHDCVLFCGGWWTGHVANREEELGSVCVVKYYERPVGMTLADDLEIEIMFGLGMTLAWVERHGEIQLVEWVPSFDQ